MPIGKTNTDLVFFLACQLKMNNFGENNKNGCALVVV